MSLDQHPPRRQSTRPQPRPPGPGTTPRGPGPIRKAPPGPQVGLILASVVAVGALIVLFGVGAAAEEAGRADPRPAVNGPAERSSAPPSTAAKAPGLGQPVRDGKFEFVVRRVDCSRSTVGREQLTRRATGTYCVLSLSIRNIADRPQYFLGSAQKVFDSAGTEFTNDEVAGFLANPRTQTLLRKIDPGRTVSGKIVFDVPAETKLITMELHDSYFSGGVRVTLR